MPIYKMKGKKDGLQKYRVRINYRDGLGAARQLDRVAYGSEEAKALEWKLVHEMKNEGITKKLTIQELFDEYIRVKKQETRESSVDRSVRIFSKYISPAMGAMKLDKLTVPVLQKWKTDVGDKPLKIITKKNVYSVFRAILNYAVKMEYIPRNPLVKIGNFRDPNQDKRKIDFYTPEEFLKFIAVARQKAEDASDLFEWHYYVFFNIAFYMGLRKGEIHALRWNRIRGDIMIVNRSITQNLKGDDRETPTKNASSMREIKIPVPLKNILDDHYKRCSEQEGFSDDQMICGGKRPLRDSTLKYRNIALAKNAGIKKIRIHDFRHSHVSLLINERINIMEIARRMGHSNIEETLNTYAHLYPREEDRAVDVLNKIV